VTFSDLQANVVADLIRRELHVHAFKQPTVAGIIDLIRMLGAMVDTGEPAEGLVARLEAGRFQARRWSECLSKRLGSPEPSEARCAEFVCVNEGADGFKWGSLEKGDWFEPLLLRQVCGVDGPAWPEGTRGGAKLTCRCVRFCLPQIAGGR
jgi:hypothetical protein